MLHNSFPPDCEIRQPLLLDSAKALLGFVKDLEVVLEELRTKLFGEAGKPNDLSTRDNLEDTIKFTCTLAACLVGTARTISARLGELSKAA